MSLSIGIVGLPNVGKSTLFNALLKKQAALAANYPFATIEPNVGVVEVPDERLEVLAQVVRNDFGAKKGDRDLPEKIVHAQVSFYDIAGLVKDAHKGEGLGNAFLANIREVDAIAHVVRDFEDERVIRAGAVSPQEDISVIETELLTADLIVLEKALERAQEAVRRGGDKNASLRVLAFDKALKQVSAGNFINSDNFSEEELEVLTSTNLLSLKPQIYVFNIGESQVGKYYDQNSTEKRSVYICAKLESELAGLSASEAAEYMKELGVVESGLNQLIKASYSLLGLQSFLTAGPKEVRAWTIKKGTSALKAAGEIHSDFKKGFIAAQIINYSVLKDLMSLKKAKDLGLLRLEGKTYEMQEGDIVEFRVNV